MTATFDTPATTTTDAAATPVLDLDGQAEAFGEALFMTALGALELAVIHLGCELGLYAALRGQPGRTAGEVAAAAGVDARYAREWLEHQAVAGTLTVEDPAASEDRRRFVLPEAHAIALLDQEHPAYVGALAEITAIVSRSLDPVTAAFRTGAGVPFAAYGLHDMQAGFTRPMFASCLAQEWIAALPEVHARLSSGAPARVADFGCGEGWAAIYIAEAFANVTVDGFDLDDASIAAARRHAAERGVADRVRFEVRDVTDPSLSGPYDLVMACEFIHDLADPVGALATMRRVTAADGAVLIIDENAHPTFSPSGDPIERLLYAFSILHCLPVGREAAESAETGTVMRPDTFAGYAAQAGFAGTEILAIEHPFFRF